MADEDTRKEKTSGERMLNDAMQTAGVKADEQGNISPQDMLRVKHSINSDIRYCGLNAQEIEEKKKITPEQWSAARKWYAELAKMYGYRLRIHWYIVAVSLAAFYFAYPRQPWRMWTAVALAVVIIYMAGKLGQADGYREGFLAGYENGWDNGINKMLGIDEEESRDIHERATEMKIDSGVIAHLDERKSKQP
jgi:hypothetical protein